MNKEMGNPRSSTNHQQNKHKRNYTGLPWWLSGQESACQGREHRFEPWSRKIPHATEQLSACTTATEARVPRVLAAQQEKPPQWEAHAPQPRVVPARSNQRKPVHSNEDPMQPKIKKKKSLQIINSGWGVEKREPSYTVGGNVNWFSHNGKQYGGSLKK